MSKTKTKTKVAKRKSASRKKVIAIKATSVNISRFANDIEQLENGYRKHPLALKGLRDILTARDVGAILKKIDKLQKSAIAHERAAKIKYDDIRLIATERKKDLQLTKKLARAYLNKTQQKDAGYIGVDNNYKTIVGSKGIAETVLRPSGKVLVNNEIYDAMSDIGFIDKGTEILVVRHETGQLYVKKI